MAIFDCTRAIPKQRHLVQYNLVGHYMHSKIVMSKLCKFWIHVQKRRKREQQPLATYIFFCNVHFFYKTFIYVFPYSTLFRWPTFFFLFMRKTRNFTKKKQGSVNRVFTISLKSATTHLGGWGVGSIDDGQPDNHLICACISGIFHKYMFKTFFALLYVRNTEEVAGGYFFRYNFPYTKGSRKKSSFFSGPTTKRGGGDH